MKTIGIVGGVAWPSSIAYYRTINELMAQRMGGLHCADLVLAQTDFEQIERYQREGRWDLVGDLLAAQGNKLKAAGADFASLDTARVSRNRPLPRNHASIIAHRAAATSNIAPRARHAVFAEASANALFVLREVSARRQRAK